MVRNDPFSLSRPFSFTTPFLLTGTARILSRPTASYNWNVLRTTVLPFFSATVRNWPPCDEASFRPLKS